MLDDLFELMAARRGHFLLESGHHGELWLDVDRMFVRPERLRPFARLLADMLQSFGADVACGPLTGGAFLAQMVAEEIGLAFVYADRVVQRADGELFPVDYPIPSELQDSVRGRRVVLINDVINAGSAVLGAMTSLQAAGATTIAIGALLVLGDAADALAKAHGVSLVTLARVPQRIWTPAECALCAAGAPLDPPVT